MSKKATRRAAREAFPRRRLPPRARSPRAASTAARARRTKAKAERRPGPQAAQLSSGRPSRERSWPSSISWSSSSWLARRTPGTARQRLGIAPRGVHRFHRLHLHRLLRRPVQLQPQAAQAQGPREVALPGGERCPGRATEAELGATRCCGSWPPSSASAASKAGWWAGPSATGELGRSSPDHRRGRGRGRPRSRPRGRRDACGCPGSPSPSTTAPTGWSARRLTWTWPRSAGGGILADLAERDFTVNAMAMPVDRRGRASSIRSAAWRSAARGAWRAVSERIFEDDPLRLMRAARFAHVLGLRSGPRLETAVRAQAGEIARAAPERVVTEMILTLAAGRAGDAARLWHELGLLQAVAARTRQTRATGARSSR